MNRQSWMTFLLCFWVAFFDGMDTAAMGYIAPYLLQDWQLEKTALAPVLSAALWGLALGAIFAGFLADRLGRLPVLKGAVLLFSLLSLLASRAQSMGELEALRFLTGLGLGAAMPNAVALLSDFLPPSRRALFINGMYCGFPLGIAAGGFLAAWWIPLAGWRSALFYSGLFPLLLLLPLQLYLREAPAGALQPRPSWRILAQSLWFFRWPSVWLWLAYFLGLVLFYSLINWLPLMFQAAQLSQESGARVAGFFALGGLAAVFAGYGMDRCAPQRVLMLLSLGTAACMLLSAGIWPQHLAWLAPVMILAGVCHNSVQNGLIALAAQLYPSHCRSSGVALMLGLGRFGAVVGTHLLAWCLQHNWPYPRIFMLLAIMPALLALLLGLQRRWLQKHPPEALPE